MAKIIFTARYVKNISKGQMKNYVKYIAARPNAERYAQPISDEVSALQREWISKELKKSLKLKEECAAEYQAYEENPSCQTAEDLIHKIAEVQIYHGNDMKNYVGYLAKRPRAEFTEQGHALWNDRDEKIDLRKVQKEATEYQGRIWNFVVSLKREDAQRLGYDNAKVWRNLVTQKSLAMAKEMRIKPENLVWYGAFHNEGHHPHIHIMCYSKDQKEGYLTKKGIENLRSALAHEIFHDEFFHLYEQKDEMRKWIREECRTLLERSLSLEHKENPYAQALLFTLAKNLQTAKHKKVYGRLAKENKLLVDEIISEISKDEKIDSLYQSWLDLKDEVISFYDGKGYARHSFSEEPEFRNIKNMVLKTALEISNMQMENQHRKKNQIQNEIIRNHLIRLLKEVSNMVVEDYEKQDAVIQTIDRKLRQKIQEKKEAHGMKMG